MTKSDSNDTGISQNRHARLRELADSLTELGRRHPNTDRNTASQWGMFERWCQAEGLQALPADTETLLRYLADRSQDLKASSLAVAFKAIKAKHRQLDPSWNAEEPVYALLRGVRLKKAEPVKKKRALFLEDLKRGLAGASSRDRAVLLLGFGCALRRSEVTALRKTDIEIGEEGCAVYIAQSKTDADARGSWLYIPRLEDKSLCPVAALEAWLPEAEGESLFGISDDTVSRIVKRAAERAGLDPNLYAGHSLRSGLISDSARSGAEGWSIMGVSRHSSEKMVREYIQEAKAGENHPLHKILKAMQTVDR